MIAYAQTTIPLLESIKVDIVNPLIILIMAVSLVIFLWGVLEAVWGANDPAKRDAGRKHILWGLVGIIIMVSTFGIIHLICNAVTAQC